MRNLYRAYLNNVMVGLKFASIGKSLIHIKPNKRFLIMLVTLIIRYMSSVIYKHGYQKMYRFFCCLKHINFGMHRRPGLQWHIITDCEPVSKWLMLIRLVVRNGRFTPSKWETPCSIWHPRPLYRLVWKINSRSREIASMACGEERWELHGLTNWTYRANMQGTYHGHARSKCNFLIIYKSYEHSSEPQQSGQHSIYTYKMHGISIIQAYAIWPSI